MLKGIDLNFESQQLHCFFYGLEQKKWL